MTKEGLKKVAVFCIIKSNNMYLLLQRAKEPNKGRFVPVGGKIDPFETPYSAIKRETFEETGIILSDVKFCGMLTESSPTEYNWVSFIYCADIEFIPAPGCDEGILSWICESDLEKLDTPPTDWFIYQYVAHGKPFVFSAEYDTNMQLINMVDEMENTIIVKNPK